MSNTQSPSSFYNQQGQQFTEQNPSGPAQTQVTEQNTNAPSSMYKGNLANTTALTSPTFIQAIAPQAHYFLTGLNVDGSWDTAQPSFADISGTPTFAQLPLFTQNGSTVGRGLQAKMRDVFSLSDFIPPGTVTATTDCSGFLQTAINYLHVQVGGGTIVVPPGSFEINAQVTIYNGVQIIGAGPNATYFITHSDITVFSLDPGASCAGVSGCTVFGYGFEATPAFGASHPTLEVQGVGNIFRDLVVWGGSACIDVPGVDCFFEDVITVEAYGPAQVTSSGANWWVRCKHDFNATGITPTNSPAYPNWAATTAVTAGQVYVASGGAYLIQASVGGTTGSSAPTLQNYGFTFSDGSVTWRLYAPASYTGLSLTATSEGETHFVQCDFSGSWTNTSIVLNGTQVAAAFTDCVISSGLTLTQAKWLSLLNNELAGTVNVGAGFTGSLNIRGNWGAGSNLNVIVAAGVSNFDISHNDLGGGSVTVISGASDHYQIVNNRNGTITDGGSGTHKAVQSGEQVPVAGLSTLGGVFAFTPFAHKFITAINADGTCTVAQPAFSDIAGTVAPTQLPAPTNTTLGGVEANPGTAHEWLKSINTDGSSTFSQPAFSDVSGTIGATQFPSYTRVTSGLFAPTGTTSLAPTHVMMGCGFLFTPNVTGNVLISMICVANNNTANDGYNARLRYGTGTAPANGAAEAGSPVGAVSALADIAVANAFTNCVIPPVLVTGLTVGTQYWLDASLAARTGGTALISNIQFSVTEI